MTQQNESRIASALAQFIRLENSVAESIDPREPFSEDEHKCLRCGEQPMTCDCETTNDN